MVVVSISKEKCSIDRTFLLQNAYPQTHPPLNTAQNPHRYFMGLTGHSHFDLITAELIGSESIMPPPIFWDGFIMLLKYINLLIRLEPVSSTAVLLAQSTPWLLSSPQSSQFCCLPTHPTSSETQDPPTPPPYHRATPTHTYSEHLLKSLSSPCFPAMSGFHWCTYLMSPTPQ